MTTKFRIRGTEAELNALKQEIVDKIGETSVEISDKLPVSHNLVSRRNFRQTELFDIVLALGLGLATNAIYDGLKQLLMTYAAQKRIEIVVEEETPDNKNTPRKKE